MSQKSVLKKLLEKSVPDDGLSETPLGVFSSFMTYAGNYTGSRIEKIPHEDTVRFLSQDVIKSLLLLNHGEINSILRVFNHIQSFNLKPSLNDSYFNLSNLCYLMCYDLPDKKDKERIEDLTRGILATWLKFLYNIEFELEEI